MKLDKTMFLIIAIITLFFIICVGILARYGAKISTDSSFILFFNWYIALVLVNLLNILTTVLFHYFMTDLPGESGDKGKIGEKGLQGDDDICLCRGIDENVNVITLDETQNIHSHTSIVSGEPAGSYNPEGSLIHKHYGHPA
jgi:membrane protein implicated in regulation of membrane protease activity